jgi:hypothetical protein
MIVKFPNDLLGSKYPNGMYLGIAIQAALDFKQGKHANPYSYQKESAIYSIYEIRYHDAEKGLIKIIKE